MKARVLICGILVFFCINNCMSQEWIRLYNDTLNVLVKEVEEHYDHGFLFFGAKYENAYFASGWVMKTDVNGNPLWERRLSHANKFAQLFGAKGSDDGGIVAVGITNKLSSSCYDPFIIKINQCFEKEWCRIFDAPYCDCDGQDIQNTPDGGYMELIARWKNGEENKIWLFRLDSLGEVIWAQVYSTDPEWNSEWPWSLVRTTDNCFVITGEAYYPDPTYPNKWIIKIILIKVNLDGESIFEVPWGTDNGVYSDGRLSVVDAKNNIYTAGRRARKETPYGDSPTLFKTSMTGEPVFYKDLKLTSSLGIATTVNWFQDSTFALCAQWKYLTGIDTTGVIRTDSLGNYLDQIVFSDNYGIYGSDLTFNNRLILGGTGYSNGHFYGVAIKLTSDLEFDSVYTTPFTYDSLCPHPITSDTIPLDDCEVVVVGIDDPVQNPAKTRLKVYPNPAANTITVEMPEYLVRSQESGGQGSGGQKSGVRRSGSQGGNDFGIKATTYYHQWKSVRLDVFDLFGKLMHSEEIPGKTDKISLDISAWPAGMYVARIVFMNDVVGVARFLKN